MSEQTLRPDGTTVNQGSVTGAASVHAAWSDDSDASYVTDWGLKDHTDVTFSDLAPLPAGAVLKKYRVRWRRSTVGSLVQFTLAVGEIVASESIPSATGVATVSSGFQDISGEDETPINALTAVLTGQGGANALRVMELYLDVTYVELPVVTVTGPAGTLTEVNRPTAEWVGELDADGGAQTFYEVKVFDAATYGGGGFDPDEAEPATASVVVAGAASSWEGDSLPDGTYRAYVRVAQTVHGVKHWSDWSYSGFSIETPVPAVPTVLLTPEDSLGRIKLELAQGLEGDATTDGFEVQWSQDGGATWTPLLTELGGGLVAGTPATVYDYEAPNGVEVDYRVNAWHLYEGGIRAYSGWAEDAGGWESADCWLKHPTNPALSVVVLVYSYPGSTRGARVGVFQPLGRESPVVVSDTREARTGEVTFWVDDTEARDALEAIVRTGDPLLLQTAADHVPPDRWVVLGESRSSAFVDKLQVEDSLEAFDWWEVDRP